MGKHYSFLSLPKTKQGQIDFIIRKAQERLTIPICCDFKKDFELCNSISEIYEIIENVIDDSIYYE